MNKTDIKAIVFAVLSGTLLPALSDDPKRVLRRISNVIVGSLVDFSLREQSLEGWFRENGYDGSVAELVEFLNETNKPQKEKNE
jgi:hypothetical protein